MTTRAPKAGNVAAAGLAALLLAGPLALASHAQEPIRSISLFPGPGTEGVSPRAEIPPLPEPAYVAAAAAASLATVPHRMASCLASDVVGFFFGSVLRTFVWVATIGDQVGSGEGFERVGEAIVENGCGNSLIVTAEDLKRWQPQGERPAAPILQAR